MMCSVDVNLQFCNFVAFVIFSFSHYLIFSFSHFLISSFFIFHFSFSLLRFISIFQFFVCTSVQSSFDIF